MITAGADIGYGFSKAQAVSPRISRVSFPSAVGNVERIAFQNELITDGGGKVVKLNGRAYFYGDMALLQSRIVSTLLDRSRVDDPMNQQLFVALLYELIQEVGQNQPMRVVTGLPVEYFADRAKLIEQWQGVHHVEVGGEMQHFHVERVFVVPQPFGSLFATILDHEGRIANTTLAGGRVGIMDVGTYTCDFVVADALRYIEKMSGSVPVGMSRALQFVQRDILAEYGRELTLHEADRAIRSGVVRIKGEVVDVRPMADAYIEELAAYLIAKARDLWGEGVDLDTILVTGGGAAWIGEAVREVYPQAIVLEQPFWANVTGFALYGLRPATWR